MKKSTILGLLLVLLGTNVFTYATTRYLTTRRVLDGAERRLHERLKEAGYYDMVFPPNDERGIRIVPVISNAILNAGGDYYWWNDGLLFWATAALLTFAGAALTQYRPRIKHEG